MFRVLIVDDDSAKVGQITDVLESVCGKDALRVSIAQSANEAVKSLTDNAYDLLVLDVMLPTRTRESPKRDGGKMLLDTIFRQGGRLKRPHRIIGLTAFSDVHAGMSQQFESQGVQLLLYADNSEAWTAPFANAVSYQVGVGESEGSEFQDDVCIVTAMKQTELEAVLKLPGGWTSELIEGDDTQYFRGMFTGRQGDKSVLAAAAMEVGMAAAACLAVKMVYNFRPRYLCMCGITAGVGLRFGDVVIAERSWDYGSGKYITMDDGRIKFLPEPKQFAVKAAVREHIATYLATKRDAFATIQTRWEGPAQPNLMQVTFGPMASGAAVVENQTVMDGLREQNRKTAAVEMEAYGLFTAAETCSKPRPDVIIAKGVCDFGVPPKTDEFHKFAAFTSAHVMHQLLTECLP